MSGTAKQLLGLTAAAGALILTGFLVWYGLFCKNNTVPEQNGTLVEYRWDSWTEEEELI